MVATTARLRRYCERGRVSVVKRRLWRDSRRRAQRGTMRRRSPALVRAAARSPRSRCPSIPRHVRAATRRSRPMRVFARNAGQGSASRRPRRPGDAAPSPPAERRQVAILFADLSGYTRLSSTLDAEEVHRLLSRYFELVDGVIGQLGGTIDKHIGDAVMAVFGAPVAHGNDTERALRAAGQIHDAMATLTREFGRPLASHIGIASGEVVAADTGSATHRNYTMTGDAVNLAARLVELARAGETVISDDVYRALAHLIDADPQGSVPIRGLGRELPVWKLRALRSSGAQQGLLIGREDEVQRFRGVLARVAARRTGATVLVCADPGMGKTRLAEEFLATCREPGTTHCHSAIGPRFRHDAGPRRDPSASTRAWSASAPTRRARRSTRRTRPGHRRGARRRRGRAVRRGPARDAAAAGQPLRRHGQRRAHRRASCARCHRMRRAGQRACGRSRCWSRTCTGRRRGSRRACASWRHAPRAAMRAGADVAARGQRGRAGVAGRRRHPFRSRAARHHRRAGAGADIPHRQSRRGAALRRARAGQSAVPDAAPAQRRRRRGDPGDDPERGPGAARRAAAAGQGRAASGIGDRSALRAGRRCGTCCRTPTTTARRCRRATSSGARRARAGNGCSGTR